MKLQILFHFGTTLFLSLIVSSIALAKKKPEPKAPEEVVKEEVPFKTNNKGAFFFDPVLCEYKIKRADLEIKLVNVPELNIYNFYIKFPDNRTVLGHVGSISAPKRKAECFHSLTTTEKSNYRVRLNQLTWKGSEHPAQNCLADIKADLKLAEERQKRPELTDSDARATRNNKDYAENQTLYRLATASEIDYEPVTSKEKWQNKKIVKIQEGAGLSFFDGFGPEVGGRVERKDFIVSGQDREKCSEAGRANAVALEENLPMKKIISNKARNSRGEADSSPSRAIQGRGMESSTPVK